MIKNNIKILKKSILYTLAYCRAVQTPLTLVQIGRYLVRKKSDAPLASGEPPRPAGRQVSPPYATASVARQSAGRQEEANANLSEIKEVLNNLVEQGIVIEQKGLYWLKTDNIIKKQPTNTLDDTTLNYKLRVASYIRFIQLEKAAQRKINKVRKALKLFSRIPFLRGIFICGSVARKVSSPKSDIDFLILTKQNRVWMVRLFLTGFAFILGKKTRDNKLTINPLSENILKNTRTEKREKSSRKDKFCLNHYRSSFKLSLEEDLRDLYSAQEYARMINIYSPDKIERKFFKKNKNWMKKYLPNFNFTKSPIHNPLVATDRKNFPAQSKGMKIWLEYMLAGKIGNIIEKLLFHLQVQKIKFGSKDFSFVNKRIIADKEVIIFHLNPRAPQLLNKFKQILTCLASSQATNNY